MTGNADELSLENRFAIQMDRVALITGGGRGLGRAFAVALAKEGLRVAVASRNAEELNATLSLLRAEQVRCVAIPTDVTNDAAVRKMVSITQEQLGPISLLVNAACPSGQRGGPTPMNGGGMSR